MLVFVHRPFVDVPSKKEQVAYQCALAGVDVANYNQIEQRLRSRPLLFVLLLYNGRINLGDSGWLRRCRDFGKVRRKLP